MPDATSPQRSFAERSLAEQALANLVDQFARPLDFLRELVQNSIDAGSPRVDVWVDHDRGVLSIGVDDHGSGMDEATIDDQLLSLYASTKEDDRTKIGKFGIGFTSVFALRPDRVLVRTGRHGTWWELVAGPERVFEKHRSSEPISGTQVLLLKRMAPERIEPTITEVRSVLAYWCEHALVPITFEDRRQAADAAPEQAADPFSDIEAPPVDSVNRPMDLEEAWLREGATIDMEGLGTVEIVLGYAHSPSYGFYNGGLTLLRTSDDEVLGDYAARLRHLSFKVRSDRLEHTLTRDNVRRDEAWRRTLDAIARAQLALRRRLLDHLEAAAAHGRSLADGHDRLADELAIDPTFAKQVLDRAVLRDVKGEPLTPRVALARGRAVVALVDHPVGCAARDQGHAIVEDAPTTRRLLLGLLSARGRLAGHGASHGPGVVSVDDVWLQATPLDPSTRSTAEQQLLDRAQALLAVATTPTAGFLPLMGDVALRSADPERIGLRLVRFLRAPDAAPLGPGDPICVSGPADGTLFPRPTGDLGMRRRTLLIDVDHPAFALHRASAYHDLELAALGLVHALVHTEGLDRANLQPSELRRLLAAVRTEAS